jgi:4-hydroxy-tetrahydrodipicolinate reductase
MGPYGRPDRDTALSSGADAVVIATTSFLTDIADDLREAVRAGSNVITTAEEAAFPWAIDPALVEELDQLGRQHGVTILGAGLNPGFAFDSLVLTTLGVVAEVQSLRVERIVDVSGFSATILRRLGIGYTLEEFEEGVKGGSISGHIGFPQSMRIVASRLGFELEQIKRKIKPMVLDRTMPCAGMTLETGQTGGFIQEYVGMVAGKPWFTADFTGHIDLALIDRAPRDRIEISGPTPISFETMPGFNPQLATPALIANSLRRLIDARAGWVTVGELPPAVPV